MHPVIAERLANQLLAAPATTPLEVVARLAAMQSQDFAGGLWAVGVRTRDATVDAVGALFDRGEILRTHMMRTTHHFVARDDLRWLLALLAPRGHAKCVQRHRNLGLDGKTLDRAIRALDRALAGGRDLTRAEVARVLTRAKISVEGQRLPHIVLHAELVGLVCSGPRRGKQITIARLDDRASEGKRLGRDAALRELALRYFTTRGPATVRDFVWWTGLRVADANAAIEHAKLDAETIDGTTYYRGTAIRRVKRGTFLLPPFDELTVAYQHRAHLGSAPASIEGEMQRWLLAPNVVVDGEVVGTWKRTLRTKQVAIELLPWRRLAARERAAIDAAAERYAAFVGLELA